MARRPVILSASRRTDLPGWHPEALAARLDGWLEREEGPLFAGDPAPGGEGRAPGSVARAPGGEDRAPGSGVRAPGGGARAPGSGARAPGGEDRAPGWKDRAPGFGARALGSGARRPRAGTDDRPRAAPAAATSGGIYDVVFWTRFPGALLAPPLLPRVEALLPAVVVNLTLTGLGRTRLEPRAPDTADALADAARLASLLGDPARLRWRFDPLLPTDAPEPDHSGEPAGALEPAGGLVDRFRRIADAMARLGVPTCTLSFPADRSLRGPLQGRYRELGVPAWPDRQARADALAALAEEARPRGIQLLACSQPETCELHPAVAPAQCIPLDVLWAAHPGPSLPPEAWGKDSSQRRRCRCPPSVDLGDYRTDPCETGCLYCYSPLGGPDAGQTLPWFLRRR